MGAENLTVLVRYLCAIGAPFLWLCAKRGNKPQQARVPQSTHYSHLWVFVKICKKLKSHLRLWRLWVRPPSGRPRIIAVCEHSQAAIFYQRTTFVQQYAAFYGLGVIISIAYHLQYTCPMLYLIIVISSFAAYWLKSQNRHSIINVTI